MYITRNGSNWDGKWRTADGRTIARGETVRSSDYYDLAVKNNNVLDLYINGYTLAVNKLTMNPGNGTLSGSSIIEYNVETGVLTMPQPTPPPGDFVFVG